MRYLALAALLLGALALTAKAKDEHDYAQPGWGTQATFQANGDTPTTASVSCTSNATAVALVAAVTDRTRRRVCFQNQGNTTVKIGSSTVSASDLFTLGESTNSATSPLFCTSNTGAFYCTAGLSATQTVVVLTESASQP